MRALSFIPAVLLSLCACGGSVRSDLLSSSSSGGGASSGGTSSGGTSSGGASSGGASSGGVPLDCNAGYECQLVPRACCGTCGVPSLSDMIAIPDSQTDAYRDAVCTPPTPCPKCASIGDPNLMATCRANQCVAMDIRTDPEFSKCSKDEDCVLRNGSECCEACGPSEPSQVIAVSINGTRRLTESACMPASACPECATAYPGLRARCQNSRCTVSKK